MPRKQSLRISLIGAGNVGTTLALLLRRKGHRIESIISRGSKRLTIASRLLKAPHVSRSLSKLSPLTDFILIATPDNQIAVVARALAEQSHLQWRKMAVAHTSGVLTSDVLAPLVRNGALTFSLHPIQSFPKHVSPPLQAKAMNGISYGVEGSPAGLGVAGRLVRDLGGRIFVVPKEKKILYHLACVFASNYSVVALAVAEKLGKQAGGKSALSHLSPLIQSSTDNALRLLPGKALTGPIVRGDRETVRLHLRALKGERGQLLALYRELGRFALEVGRRRGSLSREQEKEISRLLTK